MTEKPKARAATRPRLDLRLPSWSRQTFLACLPIAAFIVCAIVLITMAMVKTPERRGDGQEYYLSMISLSNHRSPDVTPEDVNDYQLLKLKDRDSSQTFDLDFRGKLDPYLGYQRTESGRQYAFHFWLYPLLAVPLQQYLHFSNFDELKAFQLLNALSLIAALGAVMFYSGMEKAKRLLMSALLLVTPALWYLDWPSPETFSYSLAIISIVLFSRNKHALSIMAAALAATQNPPLAFLAGLVLIHGVVGAVRDKKYTASLPLIAAVSPILAPMIFYYIHFRTPNLIYKLGLASFSEISLGRTWSFFFDLNQGMAPYVPGIIALFAFLILTAWRRRQTRIYEVLGVIVLMTLLAQTTTNLNSGTEGPLRYVIWFLPLLIWGIMEAIDIRSRPQQLALAAVLISQLIIVFQFPSWFFDADDYDRQRQFLDTHLEHNALAKYVLDNHPSLYDPQPEIFVERTMHSEIEYLERLPILYARQDGVVTKILTDSSSIERLAFYADIDPAFIEKQKDEHLGQEGLFYLNLSGGEIRITEQDQPLAEFSAELKINSEVPRMDRASAYLVPLVVKNTGSETWHAAGAHPIGAALHLLDKDGNGLKLDQSRLLIMHQVKPGEEITFNMTLTTPEEPGVYIVEFDVFQEGIGWFKAKGNPPAGLKIEVV